MVNACYAYPSIISGFISLPKYGTDSDKDFKMKNDLPLWPIWVLRIDNSRTYVVNLIVSKKSKKIL